MHRCALKVDHLGIVKSIQHSTAGEIKFPGKLTFSCVCCVMSEPSLSGPAVSYSDIQPSVRLAPPTLGQHTDEVLGELLGYSKEKLHELKQNGVI